MKKLTLVLVALTSMISLSASADSYLCTGYGETITVNVSGNSMKLNINSEMEAEAFIEEDFGIKYFSSDNFSHNGAIYHVKGEAGFSRSGKLSHLDFMLITGLKREIDARLTCVAE